MAPQTDVVEYEYVSPGPVATQFLRSDSFVCGIRGPVGSGKSTACVVKLLELARRQPIGKDGRRHSRFAVIRNTYPELKTTTIKTWHAWVPETLGHWVSQGPPTHRIVDAELDIEVIFLSVDRPQQWRKLLSLELTGAWVNEARELPKGAIDLILSRLGRYPHKRDGGCFNPQLFMDTNSPEVGHWWYVLAERDTSSEANADMIKSIDLAEQEMRAAGKLGKRQTLFEFFAQPDALRPDAENRANLPSDYYSKLSAGKSEQWIKVYVRGEYGFIQDGRPVYPEFREALHVKMFELNPRLPISVGCDFGNTPAATIGQRSFTGIHRARWEVVSNGMGAMQFANTLRGFLNERCSAFDIESIAGDPAGNQTNYQTKSVDIDETAFKIMQANGVDIHPASTNEWTLRREAVANSMNRLIDGEAGWQCHGQGCPILRRGMEGQYRYLKVAIMNTDRYHEKPDKNSYSHVCEAEQYRLVGIGEHRVVLRGTLGGQRRSRPAYTLT